MPTVVCWFYFKNSNMRFVFSYISGCSSDIIRLNQICCRCKCITVDLKVLSIQQNLLVQSYTEWVAPQGVSLWDACGWRRHQSYALSTGLTFCFNCAAWKCGCDSEVSFWITSIQSSIHVKVPQLSETYQFKLNILFISLRDFHNQTILLLFTARLSHWSWLEINIMRSQDSIEWQQWGKAWLPNAALDFF